MELNDLLMQHLESLGPIRFSNSFGWICIYTGKNMLGGYKIVDNNILLLFLILSENGFKEALNYNFEKFDFGKTWVQTEINGEDDLQRIIPYLTDAFDFSKERKKIKELKKI